MTNINNLQNEIMKQLKYYAADVKEQVEAIQQETAKKLQKNIQRDSPEKTGDYAKGWKIKREGKKLIIHNATDYQLTHLLEHGHAKKNGGRVEGKAHIRPNEETAIREYIDKIERVIES